MIEKIINAIKNEFTESEEERCIREERKNQIIIQHQMLDKKKCPVCGGNSFDKGYISVTGEHAIAVSDIITYHGNSENGYYNNGCKSLVHVCATCGYVLTFADFTTQRQIKLNK